MPGQSQRKRSLLLLGNGTPWYLSGGVSRWNCVAAYRAIGAASLADSYVNLANPGIYNLTAPTAAPTFDPSIGWTFNGSTQYLATGITPSDCRNYSMVIRVSSITTTSGYAAGYYNGSAGWLLAPMRSDALRISSGGTVSITYPGVSIGVVIIAGDKIYIDGVLRGTITTSVPPQMEIYLGADKYHVGSPPVHTYFAGSISHYAVYNKILSAEEAVAVSSALLIDLDGVPDYTFISIPDTQVTVETFPTRIPYIANWIVANRDLLHIQAVLHTGDIVDDATVAQYDSAEGYWTPLEAANIPFLLAIGNHDYDMLNTRLSTVWNTYYPQSRYTGRAGWSGGFYAVGHSENAYMIIGDYLFLSIEWGTSDPVIAWAASIIAANPTKRIWILTHSFEFPTGRLVTVGDESAPGAGGDPNYRNGDEVWAAMVKLYPNIKWVQSGHHLTAVTTGRHIGVGDNGNNVMCSYANWQVPQTNYIRVIKIYDGGNTIKVRTYDPFVGFWLTDTTNQFTVTYP